MGIQINGQTDSISAIDGSLTFSTSSVQQVADINATGIITAASANFTGNVSVGGTLTYQDVTNIDSIGIVTARAGVKVPDNQKVFLGTDSDLEIYHDGSNARIRNTTGQLWLQSDNGIRFVDSDVNESTARFTDNGAVELYYDGSLKLSTAAGGVNVAGNINLNSADSYEIRLGANNDLKLYHDGTDSWIDNTEGDLYLRTTGSGDDIIIRAKDDVLIQTQSSEGAIIARGDGQVELYHNNSKKFETTADGVEVTGALDLSAIDASISDTATDIFVYDTTKDSDGGAWRKRTQHTSWYNETLNTATRGSRKEFPAVAVIVSTTTKVTIYDGDDPDLPMWMVFNGSSTNGFNNAPLLQYSGQNGYPTAALNGVLMLGQRTNGDNWGNPIVNFISEYIVRADPHSTEGGQFNGTISQRNDNVGFKVKGSGPIITNSQINAVAMTVQPNAPIDPGSGLPTPTIALGHESGISIITDVNNSVVKNINTDGTVGPSVDFIDFYNETSIVCGWDTVGGGTRNTYTYNIPTNATNTASTSSIVRGRYVDPSTASGSQIYYSQDPARVTKVLGLKDNRFIMVPNSYNPALTLIDENIADTNAPNGMSAFIDTDFNTGWMQGRCKLATLSSTSTTSLTNGQTETDRSPNNLHLTVNGTITKTAVATGAELVGYSGWSSSNYLQRAYDANFNFGSGTFSVTGWFKTTGSGTIICRGTSDGDETFRIYVDNNSYGIYFDYGGGSDFSYITNGFVKNSLFNNQWNHFVCQATASGDVKMYVNGVSEGVTVAGTPPSSFSSTNTNILRVGCTYNGANPFSGHIALLRVSASAPSAEQVKRMYDDEKMLFQENAKATVYGSSGVTDIVRALAYDEVNDTYHVATPNGRSDFRGLRRINNTTTAVTTAISAHDGFIVEQ